MGRYNKVFTTCLGTLLKLILGSLLNKKKRKSSHFLDFFAVDDVFYSSRARRASFPKVSGKGLLIINLT